MRAHDGIFRRIRRWLRHRLLDVRPVYACVDSSLPPCLHPKSAIVVMVIALGILSALPALAADVLIVQAGRNAAYGEAVRGFQESYRGSVQTIVLADYAEVDVVRLVKEEQPRLVLAVGDKALAASKKVRQVPVLALMALDFDLARHPVHVSGVAMLPSTATYLELFRNLGTKRVGVVHDPAKSAHYLEMAQTKAPQVGIKLVVQQVRSSRDTLGQLQQLKGKVDALWMLPDTTTVTAETVEAWFAFAVSENLPLVTFSESYLAKGAIASLDLDRTDLGRQAAEMVTALLAPGRQQVVQRPRKTQLHTNDSVAHRLGIKLPAVAP